jgi:signal transduction histidine kinase
MMVISKLSQHNISNPMHLVVGACLILWLSLFVAMHYLAHGAEQISALTAKLEFVVHFATLFFLVKIYRSAVNAESRVIAWLLGINFWLFIVDFCFYLAAYANDSLLLKMSFVNFLLYYAPCVIYGVLLVVFLSSILLKDVLKMQGFIKIVLALAVVNVIILYLFFSSIEYAFGVISFQTVSQILHLCILLVLFDFSILGLIYANNVGMVLLLTGTIILTAGNFFLTYSYLSQTTSLFAYGELLWFLGLLFIMFFVLHVRNDASLFISTWFRKSNMIKSKLVFWSFSISISSFLLFVSIAHAFSIVDKQIFLWLPLFFMGYSLVVVVLSIYMGNFFELPFRKIINNIDALKAENKTAELDNDFSIAEFIDLQKYILDTMKVREEKNRIKKQLGEIAQQTAHDIRSPLAALSMTLNMVSDVLPEKIRLIMRNSVNRIRDIANNLIDNAKPAAYLEVGSQFKSVPKERSIYLLSSLIETLISEKRMQFRSKIHIGIEATVGPDSYGIFAKVNLVEFKRVLSNLINNAAEALKDAGNIAVSLFREDDRAVILVADKGPGIAPEILKKLGQRGETYDKTGGSGLGLYHARTTLESWGGSFQINSTVGIGTTLRLEIPLGEAPTWFVEELKLTLGQKVIAFDDDTSIHQIWQSRLSGLCDLISLSTPEQLKQWLADDSNILEQTLFLMDYELVGVRETGLQLIQELKLQKSAILVTSRFEEPKIVTSCESDGVRLIPKGMAPFVPIHVLQ